MHKRKKTPIGFTPKEKRILRQAARLDGLPWTTWLRTVGVRAAARRVRQAQRAAALRVAA